MDTDDRAVSRLRPPWAAIGWAFVFDTTCLAGLALLGVAGSSIAPHGPSVTSALPLLLPAGVLLLVMASLRRGRAGAWVTQLVLLCIVTALAMPVSIIWIPLLVAWCGPGVRDWFDPPLRRDF